jgi:NCS1 family nucleobase:cation symporter-1
LDLREAPMWGIEPVPERLRVLRFTDTVLLWGNLSVSLLVIVAGGLLVPALSLKLALLAIVVGAVAGNLMLGLAAMIGADARVPGMVVLRAPLGRRGSYLPTILNVAQNLGWTIFELLIIATAAAALSDRVFGFEALWLWKLVFGGVAIALALLGPIGFVRRYVRRFGIWVVLASLVYLTWWTLDKSQLHEFWSAAGKGGFPTFWQAVDLVLASVVSWTPLVADYTRFSRTRRSAFLGAGLGYLIPTIWMFGLGALLLLARDISDAAAIPAAVATGGVLSVIALLALTADESDEAFADVYSTAVSIQNVLPEVSQRFLIVLVAAAGTLGTFLIDLRNYSNFLYLLGSFFVPLFGVLLADWLLSGRRYSPEHFFRGAALRPAPILAWIAGFALYQWLAPVGPSWWTRLVDHADPAPWDFTASLPSFALAFGLTVASTVIARRALPRFTRPAIRFRT